MPKMPKRKADELRNLVENRRTAGRRRVVAATVAADPGVEADDTPVPVSQIGDRNLPGPSGISLAQPDQGSEAGNGPVNVNHEIINLDFNLSDQANVPHQLPSVHSSLGLHVSENMKLKIKSGLYVDLASLLETDTNSECMDNKLAVNQSGELVLKPLSHKRKILNIETWTDAFMIYSSIYLSAHPYKIQDVLKYINTIRTGAKRHVGLGWKNYDEQFRLRLASNPVSMPFGKIDYELWLLYMNSIQEATSQRVSVAKNKCYDFNHKFCTRVVCPYMHTCLNCGMNHPSRICNFNGRSAVGQRFFRGQARFNFQGTQPRSNRPGGPRFPK